MASIALSSLPGGSNSAAFAPGDLKKMKDGFMSCAHWFITELSTLRDES